MTDRISDRLLERVRLGEIDEEEAVALIKELEETEGSTRRLDELIEADADFLQRYPADVMAPRIRQRVRRARRVAEDRTQSGGIMLAARRIVASHRFAVAAVALLAVAVAAGTFLFDDEPSGTLEAVKTLSTAERGGLPHPEPSVERSSSDAVGGARSTRDTRRWSLAAAFDPRPSEEGELILGVGEAARVEAEGISRVVVDSEAFASVASDEDERHLVVSGRAPGTTPLRVVRDGESHTVFVRVATLFPSETAEEVFRTNRQTMEGCPIDKPHLWRGDEVTLRFLVGPNGRVMSVYPEASELEEKVEDCLVRAASDWTFPEMGGIATTTLELSIDRGVHTTAEVEEQARAAMRPAPAGEWPDMPDALPGWQEMSERERTETVERRTKEGTRAMLESRYREALEQCYPIRSEGGRCARIAALMAYKLGYQERACELSRGNGALIDRFDCETGQSD